MANFLDRLRRVWFVLKSTAAPDIEDLIVGHVGHCTIYWSWAEQALSDIIEIIHERSGDAIQADLPVSLSSKLTYVKKIPSLKILPVDLAEELDHVRADFAASSELRHDLTHGFLFFDKQTWRWVIYRTRYRGAKSSIDERTYDAAALVPAMTKIDVLLDRTASLRERVWDWAGIEPEPDVPLVPDK